MKKTILIVLLSAGLLSGQSKSVPQLTDAQRIDFLTVSRDWSLAQIQVQNAEKALDTAKKGLDVQAAKLRELNKKAEIAGYKLNLDTLKYEEVKPETAKK